VLSTEDFDATGSCIGLKEDACSEKATKCSWCTTKNKAFSGCNTIAQAKNLPNMFTCTNLTPKEEEADIDIFTDEYKF
jgi:hypothetical protein